MMPRSDSARRLSYAQGDPAKQHKLKPTVSITSLGGSSPYQPGERIAVACELNVPDGGAMPQRVQIRIIDGKQREHGSWAAKPKEDKGGGTYALEGQVRIPQHPGKLLDPGPGG